MAPMRISGMASGLDTQQMVTDLLNVEKSRYVTPLERNKKLNLWKREAYQSYTKDLADFMVQTQESLGLTHMGQIGALLNRDVSTYDWAKLATTNNTNIATATATSSAVNGDLDFRIEQLASGVTKYSTEQLTDGGDIVTSDKTLADGFTVDPLDYETETVDGETKQFISFDINGESFKFYDTESIEDLVKKVNDTEDLGAKLHFVDGRFTFSTDGTGSDKELLVENDKAGFFLGNDSLSNLDLEVAGYKGQDAIGYADNTIKIVSSTNTLRFNGISIKAKDVGTVSIRTEANVDVVYEKIKEFVDGYNEIVDSMNKAIGQKKDRDYYPLTDEEIEGLGEEQAKKWDEIAKQGMFNRDPVLESITSSMRSNLYKPVYDDYGNGVEDKAKISMITDIGITTGKYTEKGKLVIDEKKLKQAIADDAEAVLNVLFKPPGHDVNLDNSTISKIEDNDERLETMNAKYNEMGVFNRLLSDMTTGIKNLVEEAGPGEHASSLREVKSNILVDFVIKGSVSDIDKTIEDIVLDTYNEERRLADMEEGLWRKFSVLETTMQNLNNQSQWLQSQLANL